MTRLRLSAIDILMPAPMVLMYLCLGLMSIGVSVLYSIIVSDEIYLPDWVFGSSTWLSPSKSIEQLRLESAENRKNDTPYSPFILFFFILVLPLAFLSLSVWKQSKNGTKVTLPFSINSLRFLQWLSFSVSIAGGLLAIKYTQTGTLMAVAGTIEEKVFDKLKSQLEKKFELLSAEETNDLEAQGTPESVPLQAINSTTLTARTATRTL